MFTLHANGRLAHEPELKQISPNFLACEFRLLSSRWSAREQKEVTEAANFVCYGEDAERFASTAVKGQEVETTGYQTTSVSSKDSEKRYVQYCVTWFKLGRKPRSAYPDSDQNGRDQGGERQAQGSRGSAAGQRQGGYQREGGDQRRQAPSEDGSYGEDRYPEPPRSESRGSSSARGSSEGSIW